VREWRCENRRREEWGNHRCAMTSRGCQYDVTDGLGKGARTSIQYNATDVWRETFLYFCSANSPHLGGFVCEELLLESKEVGKRRK